MSEALAIPEHLFDKRTNRQVKRRRLSQVISEEEEEITDSVPKDDTTEEEISGDEPAKDTVVTTPPPVTPSVTPTDESVEEESITQEESLSLGQRTYVPSSQASSLPSQEHEVLPQLLQDSLDLGPSQEDSLPPGQGSFHPGSDPEEPSFITSTQAPSQASPVVRFPLGKHDDSMIPGAVDHGASQNCSQFSFSLSPPRLSQDQVNALFTTVLGRGRGLSPKRPL